MSEDDDRVTLGEVPSIADVRFLHDVRRDSDEPTAQPTSWTPKRLSEVSDEPPEPPTLGGTGLVYRGVRHVFSGPQETAKTIAAYIVGLSVVREGGLFLLIDFETGERDAKRRFRELGASDEEIGSILYLAPETKATALTIENLVSLEPDLVVVDASVGSFVLQGLDDNARKDVEQWAQLWIDPFHRAHIATLVIDHVTKNTETRGNYAIGSERKVGQTDVHLGFTTVHPIRRGSSGQYKITTHKDRPGFHKRGKLADMELVSDPESHRLTWTFKAATEVDDEHPFRPTIKMEQVSRWLEKHNEPVPMGHVEAGVGGNRDACRDAIQILIDEGYLSETAGPRNARLLEIVTAYRESNDLSSTSPDLSQMAVDNDLSSSPPPYRGGEVGDGQFGLGEVDDDDIPF